MMIGEATRRAIFGRCKILGVDDALRRGLVLELFNHSVNDATGEGTITRLSDEEGQLFLRYLLSSKSIGGRRLKFPDPLPWLKAQRGWIEQKGMNTRLNDEDGEKEQKKPVTQLHQTGSLSHDENERWRDLIDSLPGDVGGTNIKLATLKARRDALRVAREMGLTVDRAEGLLRKTASQQDGGSSWRFQVTSNQVRAFNKMLRTIRTNNVGAAW